MKFKKLKRRIIALVLVSTIIGTGYGISTLSTTVYAETVETEVSSMNSKLLEKTETNKNEKKQTQEVVKELKKERTENSNTYLMSDGTKKVEIHSEAIRFKEDGKWVEFDASLTDLDEQDKDKLNEIVGKNVDKYVRVNTASDVKHYFPAELNNQGIVMSKDKYVVSLAPVLDEIEIAISETEDIVEASAPAIISKGIVDVEMETTTEETMSTDTEEVIDIYTYKTEEDIISYSSENSVVKYEYISMNNGVKENIILNDKPEECTFRYKVDCENVVLKVNEKDRGIHVLDKKTKETVAYINPPYLIDGDGNYNYESVEYKLTDVKGETIIELTVDEEYFENKELSYPVTIDPTMVWMGDYISTVGVWSSNLGADSRTISDTLLVSNSLLNAYPYQDTEHRMYVDTSNLLTENAFVGSGGSIANTYIESAYFGFSEKAKMAYYPTGTVQIKRALGEWSQDTITWNTQPEISDDYIGEAVCTGIEGERHNLDITEWVQNIADGKYENHGLVFTCPEPGMAATIYGPAIKYIANENGQTIGSLHMIFSVFYRDMSSYDGSVSMTAKYNEETGKIETIIEETNTSKTVTGYKIFERVDNGENFVAEYEGESIDEVAQISVDNVSECVDVRACILYSDGTVMPSNIVTLEKYEEEMEETDESESVLTIVYFQETAIDTDGDGLEDGYEIWDLKTLWNEIDDEGNYLLDSDGDILPDFYEVFTLGTDPAVADNADKDSDGDGTIDLDEWSGTRLVEKEVDGVLIEVEQAGKGTDPWLADSDFDGKSDTAEVTNYRKTNGVTSQADASASQVHIGLYDRQYSVTEDGVTYTYIENLYTGIIKEIYYNYGDTNLNKRLKYFYDEKGNNTAIVEQYDDNDYTNTICITYTYNEDNNLEYICDQKTKYTMSYDSNGDMTSLKVGNQELISYEITDKLANTSETEDTESTGNEEIPVGTVIQNLEKITTYGTSIDADGNETNVGEIKTVTTVYKVAEDDVTTTATVEEIYYDGSEEISYKMEHTSEGKIKALYDYTKSQTSPTVYNYSYTDNGISVVREDFAKTVSTTIESSEEDISKNIQTTTTAYNFVDIKNNEIKYESTLTEILEDDVCLQSNIVLYNGDISNYNCSSDGKSVTSNIYSNLYDKEILNTSYSMGADSSTSYSIDIYGDEDDKTFTYTYNAAGNITAIKKDTWTASKK